ncbi:hypothetical protein CDV31_001460 [Fusarium ambrosium]|uniref:Uncharacterized protein n=1 Tax=Fusarium ambrosium TaxID=131363 RepID=A0A428UZ51_9HYPO|nr:hypothetical protein CDV31_001460 [Fusarium ambrosium]
MAQDFNAADVSQQQTKCQLYHADNQEERGCSYYYQSATKSQYQHSHPQHQHDALYTAAEAAFPQNLQHPPSGNATSTDIKIHWYHPSLMAVPWLAGFALAVGHHVYYASIDGKDAEDQRWVICVGTGFAFLVKARFAANLGIAIKQLVWTMLRRRSMSLRGIDALFAITTDPTAFLVHDIWMGMPCLVLLAVLLWGIPLAAIVTPAAISVATVTTRSNHSCDIPALNFEKRFDWKYRTPQSSLANHNKTLLGLGIRPPLSEYGLDEEGNDVADPWQYGGPTPVAEKLLRKVVIGQEILPFPSICGPNCTYITTTPGVGYNCSRISFNSTKAAYINSTDAYRKSAYIYIGVLFNDRELVALAEQREHLDKPVSDDEYFQCQPYCVIYRLNVTFVNDVRRLQVVGEEFVDRVPWPMFPGNMSLSATYKESNFWAYQALADLVGQHVQGHIWFPRGGWGGQVTTTILSYSSLVGPQSDFRNLNETLFTSVEWPKLGFRQGIVDLVRNVSISLLADPTLYIYDTSPGICETFSASSIWRYDPKALWIAYGAICLRCIILKNNVYNKKHITGPSCDRIEIRGPSTG